MNAMVTDWRARSFRIGDHLVDPRRNRIAGPEGETALQPKVIDVLCALAERQGEVLSRAELEQLADLPSREILQAQLLGLFLSPATKLVRLLNEPASALARLLKAKQEKEPKTAEASA